MRSSNARRMEIMRILSARRSETQANLALELGVSVSTIYRDIVQLTTEYPLETTQGNNGCVKVAEWYHPHKHLLTNEQQAVLERAIAHADENDRRILMEMLAEYGSPKRRCS